MAHVDLKAAFDRVARNALWLLIGLPHDLINLITALYTDTVIYVRIDAFHSN